MRYYNRKISRNIHIQGLRDMYIYGASIGRIGLLRIIHRKQGMMHAYESFPILKMHNMSFAHHVEGKKYYSRYRSHNYMGRKMNRP